MNIKLAPARLATFMIAIQIFRVASLLGDGLRLGWMGWFFAIALGYGVYLSAFYFGKAKGWRKVPGFLGLITFGPTDMWFNEMEIIRTISTVEIVSESANFMNQSADDLIWLMQVTALLFGAFPTIGAAILGWIQSIAPTVDDTGEPGTTERFINAVGKRISGRVQKFEGDETISIVRTPLLTESVSADTPKRTRNKPWRRWKQLTATDCQWIIEHDPSEVMMEYKVSGRIAKLWIGRLKRGKRPWDA